jgi:hypothetical protein
MRKTIAFCSAGIKNLLPTLFATILILAAAAALAKYEYSSITSALAAIKGEHIYVQDHVGHSSGVPAGGKFTIDYTINNLTSKSINILGSQTSCDCTVLRDLPRALPARQPSRIRAVITAPTAGKRLSGNIKIFTDDGKNPEVVLFYSADIVSAS